MTAVLEVEVANSTGTARAVVALDLGDLPKQRMWMARWDGCKDGRRHAASFLASCHPVDATVVEPVQPATLQWVKGVQRAYCEQAELLRSAGEEAVKAARTERAVLRQMVSQLTSEVTRLSSIRDAFQASSSGADVSAARGAAEANASSKIVEMRRQRERNAALASHNERVASAGATRRDAERRIKALEAKIITAFEQCVTRAEAIRALRNQQVSVYMNAYERAWRRRVYRSLFRVSVVKLPLFENSPDIQAVPWSVGDCPLLDGGATSFSESDDPSEGGDTDAPQ